MLTIQQIINEADLLVPNAYQTADKIPWLNKVNQEFFEIVKIPQSSVFTTVAAQASYVLPNDVRDNNIDKARVGLINYLSLNYEDVKPAQNFFTFNESDHKITFDPVPYAADLRAIVRYYRIATSTYVSGTLTANPDAPAEYHWIYVLGLCEKIANANNDTGKSNNYGSEYRSALAAAAQNYSKLGD